MSERKPTIPGHFASVSPGASAAFEVFEEQLELMGWYNSPHFTPTNGPKNLEDRVAAFEKVCLPTKVVSTDGWRQPANRTEFPLDPPSKKTKAKDELTVRKEKFNNNIVVHEGIWNMKPGQYNSLNLMDVKGRFADGFEGKICKFKRSNAKISVVTLPEGKNGLGIVVSKNLKVQMKLLNITMMNFDLVVFYSMEEDSEGKYKFSTTHEADGSSPESIDKVRKELGWPEFTLEEISPDWLTAKKK